VLQRSFDLDPDEVELLIAAPQGGLPPGADPNQPIDPNALPPELAGMDAGMGLPPEPQPDYSQVAQQQKIQQADEKHQLDMAIKQAKLQGAQV